MYTIDQLLKTIMSHVQLSLSTDESVLDLYVVLASGVAQLFCISLYYCCCHSILMRVFYFLAHACKCHRMSLIIFSAVRSFQPCLLVSVNVYDDTDRESHLLRLLAE